MTPRAKLSNRLGLVLVGAAGAAIILTLPLGAVLAEEKATIPNPIASKEFKDIVNKVADWIIAIAAPILTVVALYAGYLYMFSGGSEEQLKRARQTLTWAAVGFIIVLLASGAAELIKNILNVR